MLFRGCNILIAMPLGFLFVCEYVMQAVRWLSVAFTRSAIVLHFECCKQLAMPVALIQHINGRACAGDCRTRRWAVAEPEANISTQEGRYTGFAKSGRGEIIQHGSSWHRNLSWQDLESSSQVDTRNAALDCC